MARYKLIDKSYSKEEYEILGQRKTTKSDIEKWIDDNISACGLDWRAGFLVKFKNSDAIYEWRWIKNNEKVKP